MIRFFSLTLILLLAACTAPIPTQTPIQVTENPTTTTNPATGNAPGTQETTPPKETIPGLSVEVSKPGEQLLIDALSPFANAFQLTPEQSEKVKQGMGFVELKDKEGNPFVAAVTPDVPETKDFDEANIPLLIAEQGKSGKLVWQTIGLDTLGNKKDINFGASFMLKLKDGEKLNDPKYLETLKRNFGIITISQGLLWKWLEPKQGELDKWNLSDITDQITILEQIKPRAVIGNSIIFPENYPDWLKTSDYTRDQLIEILKGHVTFMVGRLKGKVTEWVVVNEPYFKIESPFIYTRPDILYQKIGPEYIEIAFQAAREADPSALLFYNDTGNHSSIKNNYANGLYTELTKKT